MENLQQIMEQIEKSMAETKQTLAHTEALYQLLKESIVTPVEEAPIAEPIIDQSVEPLLNPVERALNGLMSQVKELPKYKEESFTVVSNQPHTIAVEFKGVENPHWLELSIRENAAGEITYHLEKRLTNSDGYSGLFQTDEELLAFKYIRKEVSAHAWQPNSGNSYRKLLPELKQVCLTGELDATGLAYYADRIAELNESGGVNDKQLDKLNALMEELELNWGDQS
jgi:hypothetical protein